VKVERILIRGTNWIGDAVLTTPAITAVRKAFPDCHISLLVKPWVADIFKGSPDIDEIILYEDQFNNIIGKFKLAGLLRGKGFDIAILLQNAFDAALITWLSGIPKRIGYATDLRSLLLNKAVPARETVTSHKLQVTSKKENALSKKHHVYYYLNLLKEALNIETQDIEPALYLTEDEINRARKLINLHLATCNLHLVIGINPGAAYGSAKRWPPHRFAELIQRIINELNGGVVLFGSKSEVEIANEISCKLQVASCKLLNMAGKTTLRELMALISECDAFVANDSGPMHIASAFHIPVAAIFGSTDPKATCPLGEGHKIIRKDIPCSPCLKRECTEGHFRCMAEISTEEVFNALKEILPVQKAVFLDRDGTIIEDVGYLNNFNELKIFEGAPENFQRLKKAGFKLIGVTNQSGIARGLIKEDFVKGSNAYLQRTLGVDDFYYCPHHPDDKCQCRKPKPMLLHKAKLKHRINLKASYVIGDKTLDVLLAKAVGAKGILVLTGHNRESEHADFIAKDLSDAVDWILRQESL